MKHKLCLEDKPTKKHILERCSKKKKKKKKKKNETPLEKERRAFKKYMKKNLMEKEEDESIEEFKERELEIENIYWRKKDRQEKEKMENEYYDKCKLGLKDPNTGSSYVKKYSEMTDDELISICLPYDRQRAKHIVTHLRTHLTQVQETEGFDFDYYPGWFHGLSFVKPVDFQHFQQGGLFYFKQYDMGEMAIDQYNRENEEFRRFKFVDVVKINVNENIYYYTCYMTFRARELKPKKKGEAPSHDDDDDDLKTFQAIVLIDRVPPMKNLIAGILKCRLKLDV